jgi:hypothetical protein
MSMTSLRISQLVLEKAELIDANVELKARIEALGAELASRDRASAEAAVHAQGLENPAEQNDDPVLTRAEAMRITKAVLDSRERSGSGTATEDELAAVLDWAYETRTSAMLLKGVLDGILLIDVKDDDIIIEALQGEHHPEAVSGDSGGLRQ